ncbi:MAG: amidohydrolase family protein [bacterium]|nr:amidohydrolase family protein [bacterium]
MILFENVRAYRYDAASRRFVAHRSVLVDGESIVALDTEPTGVGVDRIDGDGATLVPAFADCHVHLAEAGYYAGPRSLAAVRSYAEFDAAVARAPRDGDMLYAGGYDDALWHDAARADARPLERHHADTYALLVRVDSHSCIVNRKTLAWLDLPPETPGIERDDAGEPTGRLALEANWSAQARFIARIPNEMRRASERRGADLARERGIAHVHAQLLGRDRDGYAADLEALRALPIAVHPKICEPDAALAEWFGLPYIGGDVFLDGSIGSCTAALSQPYRGGRGAGNLRFSDDELLAYFAGAEARGIAAGVHAIGDAAIEQCVRTWERVLGGKPSPRGARHFIEHFEMPDDAHVEACATMGITLSMQPQFHATWGAEGGMYEERLGTQRRSRMNPLRALVARGAHVCGGSDAPVCALDALAGMHAACAQQEPHACLDPHEALALYTVNAARFGYAEERTGNIAPGLRADLVLLDRDPLEDGAFARARVLRMVIAGV